MQKPVQPKLLRSKYKTTKHTQVYTKKDPIAFINKTGLKPIKGGNWNNTTKPVLVNLLNDYHFNGLNLKNTRKLKDKVDKIEGAKSKIEYTVESERVRKLHKKIRELERENFEISQNTELTELQNQVNELTTSRFVDAQKAGNIYKCYQTGLEPFLNSLYDRKHVMGKYENERNHKIIRIKQNQRILKWQVDKKKLQQGNYFLIIKSSMDKKNFTKVAETGIITQKTTQLDIHLRDNDFVTTHKRTICHDLHCQSSRTKEGTCYDELDKIDKSDKKYKENLTGIDIWQ